MRLLEGMRPPLQITSPSNPRIKRVLHLRKPRDRREAGQFVAEGMREISRALSARLTLRELFWSPQISRLSHRQLLDALPGVDPHAVSIYELPPSLLEKIAHIEHPEGVLAIFDQPTWTAERLPAPSPADLFLVAVGISKPGNLGAMARTASAVGATAVITADRDVDPFNPNAIRASTGAVFMLPTVALSDEEAIAMLKGRGARMVAATPDASTSYTDADLTGPVAIVIGAEDTGVTPAWLGAADVSVTIPMETGTVDSLNASNAAAVLLFEARRQRRVQR